MLGLPPTTEVKRPLPKAQLFKRFDWSPSQRERFDGDVSRLDFVNWISPPHHSRYCRRERSKGDILSRSITKIA